MGPKGSGLTNLVLCLLAFESVLAFADVGLRTGSHVDPKPRNLRIVFPDSPYIAIASLRTSFQLFSRAPIFTEHSLIPTRCLSHAEHNHFIGPLPHVILIKAKTYRAGLRSSSA